MKQVSFFSKTLDLLIRYDLSFDDFIYQFRIKKHAFLNIAEPIGFFFRNFSIKTLKQLLTQV